VSADFARIVVEQRGTVDDVALKEVRNAGFSEAEIVEILAHVGMNIFTNYVNHIAQTELDFPRVATSRS
jgi:alkylhydroperoxidase family enzyme